MNPEDVYQETIDYIKKLENEIVFRLDDTHLNDCQSNNDIHSFCDILIDKINQNVMWTNQINLDEQQFNDHHNNHVDDVEPHNHSSKKFSIQERSPNNLNDKHSILDQNHRNHNSIFEKPNNIDIKKKPTHELEWNNGNNKENNLLNGDSSPTCPKTNGKYSTLELDKGSNYRYSFYDNSTKFSIYLADSTLIDQIRNTFFTAINSNVLNENQLKNLTQLQIENDGHILPDFIEDALIFLSKSGLNSMGIFRRSGVKSRINTLKEQIQQKKSIDFNSTTNCVYDVADLVKTWLRDLRPHLLTVEIIEMFSKKKDCKQQEFNLWHLDDCHRYLLFVILKFLSMVSSYSQKNQMTTQNLAICFAPSICDGENEKQINRGQKCLQYCIENYESLFYLNLKDNLMIVDPKNLKLKTHTSVIIINASPNDILQRLLYERNIIDKLISRWIISNQKKDSDIFEFDLQFSWLLPIKTFILKREWGRSKIQDGWELKEIGELYNSYWIMVPNGKGQTLVKHDISLELRGLSGKWYQTTFNHIHDQQLRYLQLSFELSTTTATTTSSSNNKNFIISDV